MWTLERGKDLELLRDLEEDGEEIATLDEMPTLSRDLDRLFSAFLTLGRGRPSSFSGLPAAVPITEMEAFYRLFEFHYILPPSEFVDYMVFLDKELIEFYKSKLPKDE